MVAVSFGYVSGASGSATFGGANNRSYCTQYQNTTGVDVYVTQLQLLNITNTNASGVYRVGIFSDGAGGPRTLLAQSLSITGWTAGSPFVNLVGDPLCIPAGAYVWVALRSDGMTFNPAACTTAKTGMLRNLASTTDFPVPFSPESWELKMLPFLLIGNTVGPGDPTLIRADYVLAETLDQGYSTVRADYAFLESLDEGYAKIVADYAFSEPLCEGYSNIRVSTAFIQSLFPVGPEEYMSQNPFPGFGNSVTTPTLPAALDPFNSPLPGLTFSVHKRPSFKTRISSAASGMEVRNALMRYPIWNYELQYEFLKDSSAGDSSLKTILGFFLARQGSFDSFLFKDPDDYLVAGGAIGTGDGGTLEWPFVRVMGEFMERVGQVDIANTVEVKVNGVVVAPADYTVAMPNRLIFDTAPAIGAVITASFQYFFVCRFLEDEQDYEKFADKLWTLQACEFRSIIA